MQDCDQLGHARHLDAAGQGDADAAADHDGANQQPQAHLPFGDALGQPRRARHQHRQQHADDAVQVAALRGLLLRQTGQRADKQNARRKVGDDHGAAHQWPPFVVPAALSAVGSRRNIRSMRCVT